MARPTRRYGKSVAKKTASKAAIGRAIREARVATRLSQRALGEQLGLVGRTVTRWEMGDFAPPRRVRRALLDALAGAGRALHASLAKALDLGDELAARDAAMDAAIFEGGHVADAKPSAFRAAVALVLARAEEQGMTLEMLRERLEEKAAPPLPSTGRESPARSKAPR